MNLSNIDTKIEQSLNNDNSYKYKLSNIIAMICKYINQGKSLSYKSPLFLSKVCLIFVFLG